MFNWYVSGDVKYIVGYKDLEFRGGVRFWNIVRLEIIK